MDSSRKAGLGIAAAGVEAVHHNRGRALKLALALACGAAMMAATSVVSAEPLEGTWRVTRHGVNCATGAQVNSFQAIMQFNKGESATGFGVPPGSTPGNSTPEYGTWKHERGPRNYSFKLISNGYDDAGVLEGPTVVEGKLELQKGEDAFTYTSVVSFYDANNQLLFSRCGAATGTRFE